MMKKETVGTGKTVEEAIENAKQALGVTTEETGFEILEIAHRGGFLGLKKLPARVRVYIVEEEEEPQVKAASRPEPEEKRRRPEPERREEKRAPRPAPPPRPRAPQPPRPEEKRPQPQPEKKSAPPLPPTPEGELSEKAKVAVQYVRDILLQLGVKEPKVTAREAKEQIEIRLEGGDLGVVIGRRGETLDAVQYLTSLVANRMGGDYARVSIDSGDYRKKRAETLERLAQKIARNAVKTGRSTKLEPMNPYERRIIHAAVAKVEGATSASVGEEPNRRVVISPKNARKKAPETPPPPPKGAPRDRKPPRRDGPRPPRPGERRPPRPDAAARGPAAERVNDADIEIPQDLAPKKVRAPEPAVKEKKAPRTPTLEEKEALPLYGRIEADPEDEE